ncbi:MAG: peroxiredoxin-like family protein [Cyanobacteriota bacterium ELA615]|jgi:hypothetical protein
MTSQNQDYYSIFQQIQLQRVSNGQTDFILGDCQSAKKLLVILWPQLGDFDSLEYAWWLKRESQKLHDAGIVTRAIGIGDLASGQRFCEYTGFAETDLFVDPQAQLHSLLNLYPGLSLKIPNLSPTINAWLNLMLMCAGIGSPGTLTEVWRGYRGDRQAPQLLENEQIIHIKPLPAIQGSFFNRAGGSGFQRPFELATLRLRNMNEVLRNWTTYVPDSTYLTQRGATFLFNKQGNLLYEHKDRAILGFAADMSYPLSFLCN